MSGPISQKEYLKKYLSGGDADKKKKKKKKKDKPSSQSKGMRIVEDSLDIKNVPFGYVDEDDNPTVAEITYEDEKLKIMEEFAENKKWKKIQDRDNKDCDNSDWLSLSRQRSDPNSSPRRPVQGFQSPDRKMRHDSTSPPRINRKNVGSPRKARHGSSSPLRKTRHDSESPKRNMRNDSGSPSRKIRHDSDSPPGRVRHDSESPPRRMRHGSGSPPRQARHDSASPSVKLRYSSNSPGPSKNSRDSSQEKSVPKSQMKKQFESCSSAHSPPKRFRHDSDSPPRQRQHLGSPSPNETLKHTSKSPQTVRKRNESGALFQSHSDITRKRLSSSNEHLQTSRHHDFDSSPCSPQRNDSDTSLPRRKEDPLASTQKRKQEMTVSQAKRTAISDGKNSPRRRKRNDSDVEVSDPTPPQKNRPDTDLSPPRQKRHGSDPSPPRKKRSVTDSSPPRRKRTESAVSPQRRRMHYSDASPVRNKGDDVDVSPPRKLLDSQKGQRQERKMTTQEYLAARKHGKLKKDTPEDLARKQREAVLQSDAEEKHKQWKHGVKQVQDYKQKLTDEAHEMSKAFSRTADDVDLNKQLKDVARREDPMLEYIMKKEAKGSSQAVRPVFNGSFPPNRLDIRPGCRWDGVDRSSGFEKRWFEHQNNKRAYAEDAYKWSVSDM